MPTQGHSRDVVVLSGKRTGFGTFGGSLKDFTATDLGAISSAAAIDAAGISADQVDHTFFGNALQTSADAIYLARHVALRAGVPQEKGALTVNRLCGSGFEAIVQGAKEIILGEADVCLTGGAESMSQAPHVVRGARFGSLRLGPAGKQFEDLLWECLLDTHCDLTMAQTAEELAVPYLVSLEDVDLFEVNEAFAVVAMIAARDLAIPADKLNVNGGATALGHPIGASGARILATLIAALEHRGRRKGSASLCIGGGEATAMAVELV